MVPGSCYPGSCPGTRCSHDGGRSSSGSCSTPNGYFNRESCECPAPSRAPSPPAPAPTSGTHLHPHHRLPSMLEWEQVVGMEKGGGICAHGPPSEMGVPERTVSSQQRAGACGGCCLHHETCHPRPHRPHAPCPRRHCDNQLFDAPGITRPRNALARRWSCYPLVTW